MISVGDAVTCTVDGHPFADYVLEVEELNVIDGHALAHVRVKGSSMSTWIHLTSLEQYQEKLFIHKGDLVIREYPDGSIADSPTVFTAIEYNGSNDDVEWLVQAHVSRQYHEILASDLVPVACQYPRNKWS